MICNLCKGLQFLFVSQNKRKEWFKCPFCEGVGDITPIYPATLTISAAQQKVIAKEESRKKADEKSFRIREQQSGKAR